MKNKIAQLISFINKFDRRHTQFVYIVLALTGYVVLRTPYDGGTGPF